MVEGAVELLVFWIVPVAHPLHGNALGLEHRLLEIGLGRGAAQVTISACRTDNAQQAFSFGSQGRIRSIPNDPCLEPEQLSDFAKKNGVDLRESLFLLRPFVPAADHWRELGEKWRAAVSEFKRPPMFIGPGLFDLHLINGLIVATFAYHRDRQPLDAIRSLDSIAIVPVTPHILRGVEYHVFVAPSDQVKEPFPRHVARLNDRYSHGLTRNLAGLTIPMRRIVSLKRPRPRKAQMRSTLLIFAVLALTVYGQLVIKARALAHAVETAALQSKFHYLLAMLTDFRVLSGFVAAFLAGLCWMLAIEKLELAYAYPFMALSFVLVPLGSTFFFGEVVPPMQWLGLSLIVVGVSVSALAR